MSKQPLFDCPRFDACSVNACPLDPQYPDRPSHPDDFERKCTLGKTYRERIAARYPGALRFDGLTSREWKARRRVEAMTPEEREELRERARFAREHSLSGAR